MTDDFLPLRHIIEQSYFCHIVVMELMVEWFAYASMRLCG